MGVFFRAFLQLLWAILSKAPLESNDAMVTIDKQKAAQVWQRVTASAQPQRSLQELSEMIAQEWAQATTYLHLSRRLQGKESGVLRRLSEQEQAHTACLKGIYTLITGSAPTVRTIPPSPDAPDKILRQCYGQEMHSLAQYEARTSDPEYGQVFARLAEQEKEHLRVILELIGNLKRKQ